jgi:hypothetical protein
VNILAKPIPVEPVKLFVAILWSDEKFLQKALNQICKKWGEIDFSGPDHLFDITDYYEPEMGKGLKRRLISFSELVSPESIREAKLICNEIEEALKHDRGRRVNLDIGYLDHNKVVLASVKAAGQKIYLGDGIYADLVARYARGRYQPFEWTFLDFEDGRYDKELGEIRMKYLNQLRESKV